MLRSSFSRAMCALGLLAAGAAQAAPMKLGDCSLGNLSGNAATDCIGYVNGNDSTSALQALIGGATWHGMTLAGLTQYKDGTAGAGSSTPLFDVRQSASDESQGTLTFLQTITGPAVLTLKGGNNWAAYYLPNGGVAGATISFDIPGVQGAGLSHASIYTATTPTVPQPQPQPQPQPPAMSVPEPAGIALVALALGAAVAGTLRARRKRD